MLSVQVDISHRHHALKTGGDQFAFPGIFRPEMFAVPGDKAKDVGIKSLPRRNDIGMWYGNMVEAGIFQVRTFSAGNIFWHVKPMSGEIPFNARSNLERRTACRKRQALKSAIKNSRECTTKNADINFPLQVITVKIAKECRRNPDGILRRSKMRDILIS